MEAGLEFFATLALLDLAVFAVFFADLVVFVFVANQVSPFVWLSSQDDNTYSASTQALTYSITPPPKHSPSR